MRPLLALLCLAELCSSQTWQETCGRTQVGTVALEQALKDVSTDALVLLVASHPDDRYVLPAVWLRYGHGTRIAVLLATRGGGGQNSIGPESGDALERIRTLETEAGCSHFGGEVWYLNRPDGGFRRSATETFAEWGRDETLRDLARLIRAIRPDAVVSTHHAEEAHGHDQALVEILPEAIDLAASPSFVTESPPHTVRAFLLGAVSSSTAETLRIPVDRIEPARGLTLRRLAHDVLRMAHTSPGAPASPEVVFESELRLQPQRGAAAVTEEQFVRQLPSVFDPGTWPGAPERAAALNLLLTEGLRHRVQRREAPEQAIVAAILELRTLAEQQASAAGPAPPQVADRLRRRIEALEKLLLVVSGVQIELAVPAGTVAIGGEEFVVAVRVHVERPTPIELGAEGLDGVGATLEMVDETDGTNLVGGGLHAHATIRMPLGSRGEVDPMAARFHADRFVPPVRIRFLVGIHGIRVPAVVTVPVEQRAPAELSLVPRMLLLPSGRKTVQFSVGVARNSQFPIDEQLEVRAPAGYAIQQDRKQVTLRELRSDLFGFDVVAPDDRKAGVDVLRIRLGGTRVALPVHKIDVRMPPGLRVGLLRSQDDTLPGILGVGGLGLVWSELSDTDIAVADLLAFDTIVVDVRALRDRPDARRGFRRLLEFSCAKNRRLVVFYHKDTEFHPVGEGFMGAPFAPFQVGRTRVTRADAPVRILRPEHVLLRHPNVIRPADWDGWEQERALYMPSIYSSRYEEILETQDPDHVAERGALLYAKPGEGEYVYCALSLWRQLKKLHPGAVRLLANLLTPGSRE